MQMTATARRGMFHAAKFHHKTHNGTRTLDHKVKAFALYRLVQVPGGQKELIAIDFN